MCVRQVLCCVWRKKEGEEDQASMALAASRLSFFSPVVVSSPSIQVGSLALTHQVSTTTARCAALTTPDRTLILSERGEFVFAVGEKVIPHPDKVAKGGEDAFFVSSYNGGVLGIADGVSGWAEENVDPALFSKEFMAHAADAVGRDGAGNDPRLILKRAHAATCSVGAATAIVAILDRSGTLHVANLGDCGLRIVRKGHVVFATSPQQHYFDCPYQFSSESAQTASDAKVYEWEVLEGDTVVMGSDGLFDNVYDYDIEATVSIFSGPDDESADRTAKALASLASKHARDKSYLSPYSQEALLQGRSLPWWKKILGKNLTGGKLDDITVLVGHVIRLSSRSKQGPAAADDPVIIEDPARELKEPNDKVAADNDHSLEPGDEVV